ncbi:MAG: long-chain fatty acid--CoA ligase [Gammaproteobacteria bacterium]|nr:long-chain fatty acid--CoA ligase [Gammaproteobacteria bacterium]
MTDREHEIVERLLTFISEEDPATDDEFNAIALELFGYQFEHNVPFRRFCQQRGSTLRTVKTWRDIPAVPISAFKDLALSCCAPECAQRVFMTSGTTQGGVRGKCYHPSLDVYDASMIHNFAHRVMRGSDKIRMGILFPTEEVMPNSSLAHYLSLACAHFGAPGSGHLLGDNGVELDTLLNTLSEVTSTGEPYALLGASYSFVHVMDALHESGTQVQLPPGSFLMDTGGFKGQSRELALDEFYGELSAVFGVPRQRCLNMYGMTELSTQFYDWGNAESPAVKSGPHWIRTRVVNPLTGDDVPDGEQGVLAHTDLAHFNIVTTILTEDAGVVVDDGFLLLGRADGAEAKGCSMAVEEFLRAAKG